MKIIIFSAVIFLGITATAASRVTPVNEKVRKTFNEVFSNASTPAWNVSGDYYEASFVNASVKTRALFDSKGRLVQTIRYYTENGLPSNVLYKVKQKYAQKKMCGVIEITNSAGINYRIVLKDDKKYMHINADTNGETETVAVYARGDK
ncbi:hypothetical protein DC498_11965 [Terrimonas sp.]|uniref:hypothetical protein n=1 Tax=Terrimonas sp. TaxID=1914338 RepID=UPI000D51CC17|nr:hypothetical protein [Terrimonas sp.]PVD52095.1 hypothetical protein DC498_11965 [Terrimonas sp.]